MAKKLLLKRPAAKPPRPKAKEDITVASRIVETVSGLKPSKLKVFDVPINALVAHKENPNEQNERIFDEVVNRIKRDGFDEPIKVVPYFEKGKVVPGKYLIMSGHHRVKAAKLAGLTHVPTIIRDGWDEDRVAIELMANNMLRGNVNPYKFTEMWDKLKNRYDPEQLKQMMGLTEKKVFNALIKQVKDQLPPKAQRKLEEAKEKINSVEDLSSVLNTIFRDHGTEVDRSMIVMSYGGKKHTYIQINAATQKKLETLKARMEDNDLRCGDFFDILMSDSELVDNVYNRMTSNGQTETTEAADTE